MNLSTIEVHPPEIQRIKFRAILQPPDSRIFLPSLPGVNPRIGSPGSAGHKSNYQAVTMKLSKTVGTHSGDSCGCAMGARFLALGLITSSTWFLFHWSSSIHSGWSVLGRIFLVTFCAALVGKVVGIIRYKMQTNEKPNSQSTSLPQFPARKRKAR
jgi:hypothetical protein